MNFVGAGQAPRGTLVPTDRGRVMSIKHLRVLTANAWQLRVATQGADHVGEPVKKTKTKKERKALCGVEPLLVIITIRAGLARRTRFELVRAEPTELATLRSRPLCQRLNGMVHAGFLIKHTRHSSQIKTQVS